jgi:hypothetical protein
MLNDRSLWSGWVVRTLQGPVVTHLGVRLGRFSENRDACTLAAELYGSLGATVAAAVASSSWLVWCGWCMIVVSAVWSLMGDHAPSFVVRRARRAQPARTNRNCLANATARARNDADLAAQRE